MPVNRLNDTLMQRICELRPGQRITQTRNFVWLIIGILQSRSVCLGRIAGKIPGPAKLVSTTRRLSRLLDYPAIRVREWYEPIARQWSQAQWMCLREIRLIVDGTEVSYGHQLLMVSMVYRKRTIPIAWTLVLQARGHSSAFKQLALLNYVRQLLPMGAVVFLVGDCEFGSVEVLIWLNQWGLGSGNPRGCGLVNAGVRSAVVEVDVDELVGSGSGELCPQEERRKASRRSMEKSGRMRTPCFPGQVGVR